MRIINSHTEGEPTRLIIDGGPALGVGQLSEWRCTFAERYDTFRTFALYEPRGFDAMVGALLYESTDQSCAWGLHEIVWTRDNQGGLIGKCLARWVALGRGRR